MGTRNIVTGLWVVVFSGVMLSCSNAINSPTAPNNTTEDAHTSASTLSSSSLQITSVGVTDAGRGASGQWLYDAAVYLRAGGADVTVTKIQVQLLLSSQLLGTTSITPMLLVPANSNRDALLVVASNTHLQVSALTANVTVYFRDRNGNTGSVTATSDPCFGCWDY